VTIRDSQLSREELERYDRQIGPGLLTLAGQERLRQSAVLVTRTGGMGGPAALALVMAGVGHVIIAHSGRLESPDLNRQLLGDESLVGKPRAPHFAEYLRSMNRFVTVEAIDEEPDEMQALELARRVGCIVSAAPTFGERLRLNAAAVAARVPLIDAAQWGMSGTLIVVNPGRTACMRCLYPNDPPFEERFPVIGAISAAIGSLAALEAIKILSGTGEAAFGRLAMIDGYHARNSMVELTRDPHCRCCAGIAPTDGDAQGGCRS
jgi:molybdopterin/thiamine biosynthesis adenylyltransferase